MNKHLAEFVGTFFLVLTIGCTVIGHGSAPFAPLAIGSALVMIFAGGHISGGHFNPAVTLGVWLRGKCESNDVAPYMIFQTMGAVLAALTVKFLKGGTPVSLLHPGTVPAFLAEFFFTLALVYVVLNVATAKGTSGNSFYGLAIGFTVLVGDGCNVSARRCYEAKSRNRLSFTVITHRCIVASSSSNQP